MLEMPRAGVILSAAKDLNRKAKNNKQSQILRCAKDDTRSWHFEREKKITKGL